MVERYSSKVVVVGSIPTEGLWIGHKKKSPLEQFPPRNYTSIILVFLTILVKNELKIKCLVIV